MTQINIPVKIISDVVCPWCIIGYKRLEKAVASLEKLIPENTFHLDIQWLPFELNPNMPQGGENLREHLAAKYGTTLEGSIAARKKLTGIGKELGFEFDYFDNMRMYNTRKAHTLIHWAARFNSDEQHKQHQLKMAMFNGFFSQRKVMDDDNTLLDIVESVGLDRDDAQIALQKPELIQAVVELQNQWKQQGIQAVPAFIFKDKFLISGAHEPESFMQVLQQLSQEG